MNPLCSQGGSEVPKEWLELFDGMNDGELRELRGRLLTVLVVISSRLSQERPPASRSNGPPCVLNGVSRMLSSLKGSRVTGLRTEFARVMWWLNPDPFLSYPHLLQIGNSQNPRGPARRSPVSLEELARGLSLCVIQSELDNNLDNSLPGWCYAPAETETDNPTESARV